MSAMVPLATKATYVIAGAIGACIVQGASDPVVERTALGILGLLMLGGLPLIVRAVWDNTKAVNAGTAATQVMAEAFRALTAETRDSSRDIATGRVQAVTELKGEISSVVTSVKEKIDASTATIVTAINHGNHNKKGGSAA